MYLRFSIFTRILRTVLSGSSREPSFHNKKESIGRNLSQSAVAVFSSIMISIHYNSIVRAITQR